MSVILTDKAVGKIKGLYSEDASLQGKALRIAIESGGCSGYSYAFRFDEPKENDTKQTYDGFTLVIDQESEKVLSGSTVDYKEDFGSEGFAITNPNAKKSCGCGNSFDV